MQGFHDTGGRENTTAINKEGHNRGSIIKILEVCEETRSTNIGKYLKSDAPTWSTLLHATEEHMTDGMNKTYHALTRTVQY